MFQLKLLNLPAFLIFLSIFSSQTALGNYKYEQAVGNLVNIYKQAYPGFNEDITNLSNLVSEVRYLSVKDVNKVIEKASTFFPNVTFVKATSDFNSFAIYTKSRPVSAYNAYRVQSDFVNKIATRMENDSDISLENHFFKPGNYFTKGTLFENDELIVFMDTPDISTVYHEIVHYIFYRAGLQILNYGPNNQCHIQKSFDLDYTHYVDFGIDLAMNNPTKNENSTCYLVTSHNINNFRYFAEIDTGLIVLYYLNVSGFSKKGHFDEGYESESIYLKYNLEKHFSVPQISHKIIEYIDQHPVYPYSNIKVARDNILNLFKTR